MPTGVGAAVAGAATSAVAGKVLGGSGKAPRSKTSFVAPNWNNYDYVPPALKKQVTTADDLLNLDYSPYTGQRVAQLNADEQQALDLSRSLAGGADLSWSQGVNQQVANRGLNGLDQATLAQYMNPYIQNVMDISKQRQLDQFDLAKRDLQQRQGQTGAFGGSRASLATGQLYDNFSRQLAETEANQLYQGYNDAQTRALQGTQLAGQAAGQYGNQALQQFSSGQQGIAALGAAGALQRGIEQQGYDVNYQDYLTQQDYPYKQLSYYQGIVNPVAGLTAGTPVTTQTAGSPSGAATGLGLYTAALGSGALGNPSNWFSSGQNPAYTYNGSNMFGFGSGGANSGYYGSLGKINWFKDGGMVGVPQGLACGGMVKGYADGGLIDSISNWMNNYMNIGNDQFGTESNVDDSNSWLQDFLHTDLTGGKSLNDLYTGRSNRNGFVYPSPNTPDMPLSVRNNNAGNLRDPNTGAFRQFGSPQEGLNAMMNDLNLKVTGQSPMMKSQYGEGYQPTLQNIISTWAPKSDGNDPQMYAASVAKVMGMKPTDTLTPADVPSLAKAITAVEGGPKASKYFDTKHASTGGWAGDYVDIADYINNQDKYQKMILAKKYNEVPEYASTWDKVVNGLSNLPLATAKGVSHVGQGLASLFKAPYGILDPNFQHISGADTRNASNRAVQMANAKRAQGDLSWFNANRAAVGKKPLTSLETGNAQADAIFKSLTGKDTSTSETPKKQERYHNDALIAFGASLLGSKGSFTNALGEGIKAYQTEKATKEAEIAKLAQQAIDNKRKQQTADAYTLQAQGGPWAKELALSKLKTAQAKALGNPGKNVMDILKVFGAAGVPMDTPETQAAAVEAAKKMASNIGATGEDDQLAEYLQAAQERGISLPPSED